MCKSLSTAVNNECSFNKFSFALVKNNLDLLMLYTNYEIMNST